MARGLRALPGPGCRGPQPSVRPTPVTYVLAALMVATMVLVYVASFLNPASSRLAWLGLLAFLVVVLIGTAVALRTWGPPGPVRLVDVIASTSAAAMTLLLIRDLGIPALVAAAIVATSLGVAMLDGGPLDTVAGTAGYAGVFVGLVDPSVTIPLYWVLIAGALVGVLWGLISPALFRGAGGRMSTAAFMASILVYQVADVLGERGGAEMLPPVDGIAHWAVVPAGAVSALVTWLLVYRRGWSLPMASGVTSLLVCGSLALWGPPAIEVVVGTSWFGGTAVGRTDATQLPGAAWVGLAGLAYGAMMLRFEGPLQGHVGVIGVLGLMAVMAVIALIRGVDALTPRLSRKPRVA